MAASPIEASLEDQASSVDVDVTSLDASDGEVAPAAEPGAVMYGPPVGLLAMARRQGVDVAAAPTAARPVAPILTLTIDDDDPDRAEADRHSREQARLHERGRTSFLPPILREQERQGRQGGLTLAVIILLIAATLTLSYLMRSPGTGGDGLTSLPASSSSQLA
ncbi:MAG: hypothetical protein R2939_11685 [Kofleriaceae bacterium]